MKITIKDNYFNERTIVRVNFLTIDTDDCITGEWHSDIFGYVTNLDDSDFPENTEWGHVIKEEQIKSNIKNYLPELIKLWNTEMHDNITADDIEEITVDTKIKLGL